jgi:hypothetical protein
VGNASPTTTISPDDLSQPIVWSAGAKFAELNYCVVRAWPTPTRVRMVRQDYFSDLFAPRPRR